MAAFRTSRFVCLAVSSIVFICSSIFLLDSRDFEIISVLPLILSKTILQVFTADPDEAVLFLIISTIFSSLE
jgi:hypothetical protein